jgi:hypothetical protein
MKKLLLSTAFAVSATAAAQAQDISANFRSAADPMEIHASDFIGMRVYASEASVDANAYDGVQDGWDDIGEINDVILSRSGEVEAVLVDIGGFLGVGERQVAVDMNAIAFVSDSETADDESDFFLVMNADRAAFEGAPEYSWNKPMTDGAQTAQVDGSATTPPTDLTAQVQNDTAMSTETFARDGYKSAPTEQKTAELLTAAPVYDANDEWIGEVSEILLTDAGEVNSTVIDVGGFLGICEKPVELKLGDLYIMSEDGGDDVLVYVSATKDQLQAMPTYE